MIIQRLTDIELDDLDLIPRELAERVRLLGVPLLPGGYGAMTLGRLIITRRRGDRRLLAHELVHVKQWRDDGLVRFSWRYLSSYARGLARYKSHRDAYLAIPYEVEARALAREWSTKAVGRASPA